MNDLEPLPEDWIRGLVVVAHPDDMEYGAASAVARWTAQGKDIRYVMVTKGEAGVASMTPADATEVRMAEQVASCAAVGVTDVEFLDHPDGMVVEGLELRRDLTAAIRRHRPDVLLGINHRESWGGPSWNHADHRAVGRSLLDAARDADNAWVFTELELPRWSGVRFTAMSGSPEPTHAVDTTDHFEVGVASLRCHATYLAELGGDMADPETFLRPAAEAAGPRIGVELATTFEVVWL